MTHRRDPARLPHRLLSEPVPAPVVAFNEDALSEMGELLDMLCQQHQRADMIAGYNPLADLLGHTHEFPCLGVRRNDAFDFSAGWAGVFFAVKLPPIDRESPFYKLGVLLREQYR